MNPEIVDQIEFRWEENRDFGPIASSSTSPQFVESWRSRLKTMAASPEGATQGHRSLVYLVFPSNGLAAIIERSFDESALQIIRDTPEDGGRHPQVARALVGNSDVVGIDLALACAHEGLAALGLQPGRVPAGQLLGTLDVRRLTDFTRSVTDRLDNLPRTLTGLDVLLSAVLRDPGKPISVLVPGKYLSASSAQGDYLRGLLHTVGRLLEGARSGWLPSFSTFEPPLGRATRDLPHLVFRDLDAIGGAPPTQTRDETTIAPYNADRGSDRIQDEHTRLACGLAKAYGQLGRKGLAEVLQPIVDRHPTLDLRLKAALRDGNLAEYLPRREPDAAAPYPTQQYDPHSVQSRSPHTAAPQGKAVPTASAQPSVAESAAPMKVTLFDLYKELDAQHGKACFVEVVELICALAGPQTVLSDQDSDAIIGRIHSRHWYAADLEECFGDQAADRLSRLMYPLLACRLNDRRVVQRLGDRLGHPDTPKTWVLGVVLLCARLGGHTTTSMLGRQLAPSLVHRVHSLAAVADRQPRGGAHESSAHQRDSSRVATFLRRPVRIPVWILPAVALIVTVLLLLVGG